MKKYSEIEKSYKENQSRWKNSIRQEPNKHKRFWRWAFFLIAFPFVWLWNNLRDWRTALIFVIVFLLLSSEVWVPYLIGALCWSNESVRISMFSIGSACWIFWLGPGTPFLPLCIGITIGVKALFNKLKKGKKNEQRTN